MSENDIDIIDEIRQMVGFYTNIKPHDVLRANIDQPAPQSKNYATVLILSNDLIGSTPFFHTIEEERYTFQASIAIAFYGAEALNHANHFMMGWRGSKGVYQQTKIQKGGIEMASQVNTVFNQQNDLPRYNLNCSIFYQGIMGLNLNTVKTMSVATTRVDTGQEFFQEIQGE